MTGLWCWRAGVLAPAMHPCSCMQLSVAARQPGGCRASHVNFKVSSCCTLPWQVAHVVMDLASATIDAPALLPLASGSATAATSAVARRAMHDTGLWRAAEVSCELGQVGDC